MLRSSECVAGRISAPNTPIAMRAPSKNTAFGANAAATEESVNPPIPRISVRLWPRRSPAFPPATSRLHNTSGYASMSHNWTDAVGCKSVAITGNAKYRDV